MLPAEAVRPSGADWAAAGAVALALFALYAATAPRTVALEDDGLFILSSYFLASNILQAIRFFTLIGHLFTYLPVLAPSPTALHLASALLRRPDRRRSLALRAAP